MSAETLKKAVDNANEGAPETTVSLPGPTGESNRLSTMARPPLLCLGPGTEAANQQAEAIKSLGGRAAIADGSVLAQDLTKLDGIAGVIWWGDQAAARDYEMALATRDGAIVPLITGLPDAARARAERHVCVDTTAAGGNAALLGGGA